MSVWMRLKIWRPVERWLSQHRTSRAWHKLDQKGVWMCCICAKTELLKDYPEYGHRLCPVCAYAMSRAFNFAMERGVTLRNGETATQACCRIVSTELAQEGRWACRNRHSKPIALFEKES